MGGGEEWTKRGESGATRKGKILFLFLLLKKVDSVGIDCFCFVLKIKNGENLNRTRPHW